MEKEQASRLELRAQSFILDRQAAGRSKATIWFYQRYLDVFVAWLRERGVGDVTEITPDHLRAWYIELRQRGLAKRTIHHHASAASVFLNFTVSESWLAENANPFRKVKMPDLPDDILPAFTPEEVKLLLSSAETDRDKAILLFLLDTGVRASEFCKLTIGDVDLNTGTVMVRSGKGDKDRATFIGAKSKKALLRYLATRKDRQASDPLWLSRTTNEALTHWGLAILLRKIGKRAGVDDVHPHKFRHTFATWALDAEMDVYALQRMMGHADLDTLRRYVDRRQSKLLTAHRKHGPVDNIL
jgi:site-specific recombinase XerD